jgi:uncharacterized membrane protein
VNPAGDRNGNGPQWASTLFLVIGTLASLYLLAETVFQLNGKSICVTEGCRVVSQSIRFGDLPMVLMGLAVVALVTVLAARGMRSASASRDWLINTVLVAALAGEGFLVGDQLFRLHAVCVFCLSVLGIFIVLGLLRLLAGHWEILMGFGALLTVLGLFSLVLPAGGAALPRDGKYVLFFSPDCKHCAEIKAEIESQKLDVREVQVDEYGPTLKSLGIEEVPTLMVNGPYEKVFLTGTNIIRRYLSTCKTGQAAQSPPVVAPRRHTVVSRGGNTTPKGTLNLFPSLGTPDQIFTPPSDEGLCKENTKCE